VHEENNEVEDIDGVLNSRIYCLRLIEFISSLATDPHLYFQHKLTADISAAKNLTSLTVILNQLIDWIDTADFQSMQITKLDKMLMADELPSFSLMRALAKPEIRRILAIGRVANKREYSLVRDDILQSQEISDSDRIIVDRLLKDYESSQ